MKTFDFIIVGGGTSGTVTAEKLIKKGHTVLIIEEGKKIIILSYQCQLVGYRC